MDHLCKIHETHFKLMLIVVIWYSSSSERFVSHTIFLRLPQQTKYFIVIVRSKLTLFIIVALHDVIVELLEHVSLESHEYVNDILPAIQQSYKDVCNKAQFQYARPRLVHNSRLQDSVSHTHLLMCWFGT